jgi:AraC-like DNA-binding protein
MLSNPILALITQPQQAASIGGDGKSTFKHLPDISILTLMSGTKSRVIDEEPLIAILKSQIIPCWERFGAERLAVVAKTIKQFEAQSLPEFMRASIKKRVGKKTTSSRTRIYNNTSAFVETWPEDAQALILHPTLAFVLEGQADLHVADYLVHCPRDHFLLFTDDVPRGTGERSHLEGKDAAQRYCEVLWIFTPPGTNSVTMSICYSRGAEHWIDEYCIVHHHEAISLFKLFVREAQEKPQGYQDIATTSLQLLLRLLLRELLQGRFHRTGKSSVIGSQETAQTQIEQATQYVQTHLNQNLTAAVVARAIYMSRSSFIRHFTQETEQSFHQFVINERMEEACRLLRDGYWSISFVSQSVGLKPSQFRNQFKSHFGISPSEFREQIQRKDKNGAG